VLFMILVGCEMWAMCCLVAVVMLMVIDSATVFCFWRESSLFFSGLSPTGLAMV